MNEKIIKIKKTKRNRNFLFLILAIILVLITCYKLKIEGITMTEDIVYESILTCENIDIDHVHSEECYELVEISSLENNNLNNVNENIIKDNNINENTTVDSNNTIDTAQLNNTENDNKTFGNSEVIDNSSNVNDTENTININILDTTSQNESNTADNIVELKTAETSTDIIIDKAPSNIDIYLNINGNWENIGYVENINSEINSTDVISMIEAKTSLNLTESDFNIYHLKDSNSAYIVSKVITENKTLDELISENTLKVYSVVEKDEVGNEIASSYIYTLNNTADYILSTEYNYKINDSSDITMAGSTISITSATILQRIAIPTYTITILDVNGNTLQTNNIVEGTEFTLPAGYWYINDSEVETVGETNITINSNTTIKPVTYMVILKRIDGVTEYIKVEKGGTYTLDGNLKWKVIDQAATYNLRLSSSEQLLDGGTVLTINKDIILEEKAQITVIYKIDLSEEATTLDEEQFLYDGINIPTVGGSDTYTITVNYGESITLEDVSDKFVDPYDNLLTNKDGYKSLIRSVIEFVGWNVNETGTIKQALDIITWDELYKYAKNGIVNLNTAWELKAVHDYVNFYIRYDSIAIDIEGDTTDSRGVQNYTPSLWASYVGNYTEDAEDMADTTYDNSYTVNNAIRALYGNKNDGSIYLESFPTDDYIFDSIRKYAQNLTIDGEIVPVEELSSEHYEVRWYVFKLKKDCWHIDGKLVRKEGKITINKTFTGSKSAIEDITGYSFDKNISSTSDYYIEIINGETTTKLYLNDAEMKNSTITEKNEDGESVTTYILDYTWTTDVKYGIEYSITEKNYVFDDYIVNASNSIYDPQGPIYKKVFNVDGSYTWELDDDGNRIPIYTNQTTKTKSGDTVTIKGINNYAIDSEEVVSKDNMLNVNFTNTYIPISDVTIKKVDSITNTGLANAQFSIYEINEDGTTGAKLKFDYNNSELSYNYNENGNHDVLISSSDGFISINDIPVTKEYKLIEIKVPNGYKEDSKAEITLVPSIDNKREILVPNNLTGNKYEYSESTKILQVSNSPKLTSVEITKVWDDEVPKDYIKDVTVELYLNNISIREYDLNEDGVIDANDKIQSQVVLTSNNLTYEWNNLPLYIDGKQAIYTVREVSIGNLDAASDGEYDSSTGTWSSKDAYTQYSAKTTPQEIMVDGENTTVSFKLINTIHLIKIDINKITPLGNVLQGATFELKKLNDDGEIDTTFETRTATTDENGELYFAELEYGAKYVLNEIKAPENYYLNSSNIYVMINKVAEGQNDILTLYKDSTFTEVANAETYELVSLNGDSTELNIINISHIEMPKAGGCGTQWFYLMGIFLMGSSIVIIYLKNKIKEGM